MHFLALASVLVASIYARQRADRIDSRHYSALYGLELQEMAVLILAIAVTIYNYL